MRKQEVITKVIISSSRMFSESIVECTIDTLSLRTFMQGLQGKLASSKNFCLYQTEIHKTAPIGK